jgi:hypothetical protein
MSKTNIKEIEPKFDIKNFKESFIKGEMYHGILVNQKEINKIKSAEKTVLFKFFYFQNKLYFILYDYLDIYFSIIEDKDILDTNRSLNSSLEFKDIPSLIDFLKENLIIKNKNLIITYEEKEMNCDDEGKENISPENMNKTYYEFNLNSMVDILSIKWVIKCEKINNNFVPDLSQCIFINPIHNFLLGIGNLITIPNNILKNSTTGLYNGISIDDAKIMIKCNYLGKKVGFSSSIIDLLSTSSQIVNGVRSTPYEKTADEDDEKKAKKKQINKKNKYWGPMKHRKGEKIIFCEDNTDDKVTQSGASGMSDLVMLNENNSGENEGILSQKESAVGKDKKKKKKHFI